MQEIDQPNICPITALPLNEEPLELGIFWPRGCGHRFNMCEESFNYFSFNDTCPICGSKFANISDGAALMTMNTEAGTFFYPFAFRSEKYNFISFRREKVNYRISVDISRADTAQERIAYVLGTELDLVKILHKGKRIYPPRKLRLSDHDDRVLEKSISKQIIDTCSDLSSKPALLVMSTRRTSLDIKTKYEMEESKKRKGSLYYNIYRSIQIGAQTALETCIKISWNACNTLILFCRSLFEVPSIENTNPRSQHLD